MAFWAILLSAEIHSALSSKENPHDCWRLETVNGTEPNNLRRGSKSIESKTAAGNSAKDLLIEVMYIGDCDDRSEFQTEAPPMIFEVLSDVVFP
jgi:hypothetical protein